MSFYYSFEKIDAHMHYNTKRTTLLEKGDTEQFRFLSINVEVPSFPLIERQEQIALQLRQKKSMRLDYITTFSTEGWGNTGWPERALDHITSGIEHGAAGVKVWKNIGMTLRDELESFVMIDDSSFDSIFDFCEQNGIPVLGHLGEPRNCWLPLDEMTVEGDRVYFDEHPEYHMQRHPEYPSYEEQLEARDRRLSKHPGLRFIGAHLASLEYSVDRLAEWLDRYPNSAVDLAERVCHLQHQAVRNWKKVRDFVDHFQDRIIYGTDFIDDGTSEAGIIQERITQKWHMHWNFFSGDGIMSVPKVDRPFRGLNLDRPVLRKIFRENALNWYPELK